MAEAAERRPQLYLLGGRLLVAMLLLGGSILLADIETLGTFTRGALLWLIGATFTMSFVIALVLPRVRRLDIVAGIQIAWDIVLVTGLCYLLGGAASAFAFLYGVVILAAALVV